MKGFKDYLFESKKTYAFKIKLAGDLAEGCEEKLKAAMERFSVEKMSSGKRTPISETPLDFPTMKNSSVTLFDVEINYPTTAEVLENYISQCCGHPLHCIKVVSANLPATQYQEELNKKEAEKPLIGQCDPQPSNNQELVGDKKVSDFLKDLAKVKHAGEPYNGVNDQLLVKSTPTEKASEMPEGSTISPMGATAKKGK